MGRTTMKQNQSKTPYHLFFEPFRRYSDDFFCSFLPVFFVTLFLAISLLCRLLGFLLREELGQDLLGRLLGQGGDDE